MSKPFIELRVFPAIFSIIFAFSGIAVSQEVEATVTVSNAETSPIIAVEGRFPNPETRKNPRNLSFLKEFAGNKIAAPTDIKLFDSKGLEIPFKRLDPAEILAEREIAGWSYKRPAGIPEKRTAAAHSSWVNRTEALLMLDDILPQIYSDEKRGRVSVVVPEGWHIFGTSGTGTQNVPNIEKAVIFAGKGLRAVDSPIRLVISGEWLFSDAEAAAMAKEIFENYRSLFGSAPSEPVSVFITKFPVTTPHGEWEADTRGSTVTILSSDMPFRTRSLQRLHEQFRHEIFHLWIPNALNLSGSYDWFYEGFTLHYALRSGVHSGQIRFTDLLDTLSRAYNIDIASNANKSLIDASKERWSGSNTRVYARGMLVAFLIDVEMLRQSKGKRSIADIFREIFAKYSNAKRADGNEAVLGILRDRGELVPIVDRYITAGNAIDWDERLLSAGIRSTSRNSVVSLSVVEKPNGRQKDILDKLGYNSWRKSSSVTR